MSNKNEPNVVALKKDNNYEIENHFDHIHTAPLIVSFQLNY